jgi:Threonine synthase
VSEEELAWRCECGAYLNCPPDAFRYDPNPALPGIWRYASSLPLERPDRPVTLGEGMSPFVSCDWAYNGGTARIHCKFDAISPTGSYKDRGIAVQVSRLRELGVQRIADDSSGNAGASMAAYCAAADIPCDIYVPEAASEAKCLQIAMYGANLVKVPGPRENAGTAARESAKGAYYGGHNWSPYYIHGIKTCSFEIFEQLGNEVPDNIVCPAGQGCTIRGAFFAFSEIMKAGKSARMPRIFGVQSEACPPLYEAWRRGEKKPHPIERKPTIAEGIASLVALRGDATLDVIAKSNGGMAAVSEKAIWEGLQQLAKKGLYVEPTTATALAGLTKFLEEGVIRPDEKTVVVLTGFGLKTTELIMRLRQNPPA